MFWTPALGGLFYYHIILIELLLQIDNFRVTDSTYWTGFLTEYIIIFIVTVYFCISMSDEYIYTYYHVREAR